MERPGRLNDKCEGLLKALGSLLRSSGVPFCFVQALGGRDRNDFPHGTAFHDSPGDAVADRFQAKGSMESLRKCLKSDLLSAISQGIFGILLDPATLTDTESVLGKETSTAMTPEVFARSSGGRR